jgi:hypothetical protein
MYPLLSLSQINIDPELARRLPRRLAYYHLALPIAQDDDNITVAMAHPDNQRVIEVIHSAIGTPITPVRSHADDIRRCLDSIWQQDDPKQTGLMYWANVPIKETCSSSYVQDIAAALSLKYATSQIPDLEQFIEKVREARPALVVCETSDSKILADLLTQLTTSILLLRSSSKKPKHILLVLRGHTPDKHALDWVIPITQYHNMQLTLLVTANSVENHRGNPLISDFANLILPGHSAQAVEHGEMLASMNVGGRIKFAEGQLEHILTAEISSASYDLVAIATEVNGELIQRVIQRVAHNETSFLIIKP